MFDLFKSEGIFGYPVAALREPRPDVRRGKPVFLRQFDEAPEGVLEVAVDRVIDDLVLLVLALVDVEVDDRRVGGKFLDRAGDAVVEAGAQGDE